MLEQFLPMLRHGSCASNAVVPLETDDAAYLLESLDAAQREEILAGSPEGDRARRWSATCNTRRRRPAV